MAKQSLGATMAHRIADYMKKIAVLSEQNRVMREALARIAEGERDAATIAADALARASEPRSNDPASIENTD